MKHIEESGQVPYFFRHSCHWKNPKNGKNDLSISQQLSPLQCMCCCINLPLLSVFVAEGLFFHIIRRKIIFSACKGCLIATEGNYGPWRRRGRTGLAVRPALPLLGMRPRIAKSSHELSLWRNKNLVQHLNIWFLHRGDFHLRWRWFWTKKRFTWTQCTPHPGRRIPRSWRRWWHRQPRQLRHPGLAKASRMWRPCSTTVASEVQFEGLVVRKLDRSI